MDRLEENVMMEVVKKSVNSIIVERRESTGITIDTMRMNGT